MPFGAVFNLLDIDGSNGSNLSGGETGDLVGWSVASAGDINGDGIDDFLVGAPLGGPIGTDGSTFVVFGKTGSFGPFFNVDSTSEGFRIDGAALGDRSGYSVAGAGDINGDGIDDLIIGAFSKSISGNGFVGSAYAIFGKTSGWAPTLSLSSLDGANGFRVDGLATSDQTGISVSSAGDINGDGRDDFIVGANLADPDGLDRAGSTYVVFGKASGWAATMSLSTLTGTNGFRLDGDTAAAESGFSVAAAGDVNGDGFDDLIVGARYHNFGGGPQFGAAFVVFGKSSGWTATQKLSTLNGSNGFRLDSDNLGSQFGTSVASAGDVNGDGFSDIIIGAPAYFMGGVVTGAAFVVFGKASGWAATNSVATLNGSNGFRLQGATTLGNNEIGSSVASAGDFNGDGLDDLVVGALNSEKAYILYGKTTGWAASLAVSSLSGADGFRIERPTSQLGQSVASAGDVNDDGFDDVILGTDDGIPIDAFLVYGDAQGPLTRSGTAAGERLNGGSFNDSLSGLAGADTLHGGLGNDTLNGGGDTDTVLYRHALAAVTVNLSTGLASGHQGLDQLISIENVAGSNFGDLLIGDTGSNMLDGNLGSDMLEGGAGNDVLIGGLGNDTASYLSATGAVMVNLATGTASGADGNDVLTLIEAVLGSGFNDVLTGGLLADTLVGGGGDDLLEGGGSSDRLEGGIGNDTVTYANAPFAVTIDLAAGTGTSGALVDTLVGFEAAIGSPLNDSLTGSTGTDTLRGGLGADTLAGGLGTDLLDGGDGNDVATYEAATASVSVNLGTGIASGGAGIDVLISVEGITGSPFDDTLSAGNGGNTLLGGAGNDLIVGGSGNDSLFGSGAGDDTLSYASATAAITLNLDVFLQTTGGAGNDTIGTFGVYIGSSFGDVISGRSSSIIFDTISGGAGDDTIEGRGGNDVLIGLGGAGDIASYVSASAAVTVDLAAGSATGGAGNDTLQGFEGAFGSAHNDSLSGGNGDDVLDGRAGADTLDGRAGADTVLYSTATAAVTVNLAAGTATGGAGNDSLVSIEGVVGSAFNDVLGGTGNADTLDGGGLDDLLNGGGGADLLIGGSGIDTLNGSSGDDTLEGGAGADILDGGGGGADVARYAGAGLVLFVDAPVYNTGDALGDVLTGIERFDFSGVTGVVTYYGGGGNDRMIGGTAADRVWGNAGADTLDGGGGEDFLLPGDGVDSIIGGDGFDAVYYGDSATALSINLSTGVHTGFAAGDTFSSIEAFLLTEQGDTLVGADVGGAGDIIYGLGGNDSLTGLAGFDWLLGGDGDDTLTGGFGWDLKIGGGGADRFVFNTGGDGGSSEVIVDFTPGTDKLAFVSATSGISSFIAGPSLGRNLVIQAGAPTGTQGNTTGPVVYYDTATGYVWFDTNGNQAGGLTYLVGLTGTPTLTAADFMVI